MLTRYKKNLEKIAMGLLSFMPEEKDVKKLQQTVKEYETNPDWHLYFWREDDILGIIGIKIEEGTHAVLQHISVNPSYRNQGIGRKMINEVKKMYDGKYEFSADDFTGDFHRKCEDEQVGEK
ncbi:GNAT family N-acetyltransferase [Aciduricibacillus chroicocephali]|uniref:GNAT family N-acetyltransferase n=1 Tax=Aciduricibacillus chroicocephali TaxID=3054939 RepID=A0ABY9KV03_9BACI|nr:GNAT family N-acetyltransferase [Bacillaceae bacterium 44XB]